MSIFSAMIIAQEPASDTVQPTANEPKEEKSSIFINGSQFNFIFSWKKKILKQICHRNALDGIRRIACVFERIERRRKSGNFNIHSFESYGLCYPDKQKFPVWRRSGIRLAKIQIQRQCEPAK
jgi:hypothetical protein